MKFAFKLAMFMFMFNLSLGLLTATLHLEGAMKYQSGSEYTNLGIDGSVSPTANLESNTNTNARILDFLSIGLFSKVQPILDYMDKAFFGLPTLVSAVFEGTGDVETQEQVAFYCNILRFIIGAVYAFAIISLWTGRNLFDE